MLRGEADFREIEVSLVFVSWRSRFACSAVKHGHLRRGNDHRKRL